MEVATAAANALAKEFDCRGIIRRRLCGDVYCSIVGASVCHKGILTVIMMDDVACRDEHSNIHQTHYSSHPLYKATVPPDCHNGMLLLGVPGV